MSKRVTARLIPLLLVVALVITFALVMAYTPTTKQIRNAEAEALYYKDFGSGYYVRVEIGSGIYYDWNSGEAIPMFFDDFFVDSFDFSYEIYTDAEGSELVNSLGETAYYSEYDEEGLGTPFGAGDYAKWDDDNNYYESGNYMYVVKYNNGNDILLAKVPYEIVPIRAIRSEYEYSGSETVGDIASGIENGDVDACDLDGAYWGSLSASIYPLNYNESTREWARGDKMGNAALIMPGAYEYEIEWEEYADGDYHWADGSVTKRFTVSRSISVGDPSSGIGSLYYGNVEGSWYTPTSFVPTAEDEEHVRFVWKYIATHGEDQIFGNSTDVGTYSIYPALIEDEGYEGHYRINSVYSRENPLTGIVINKRSLQAKVMLNGQDLSMYGTSPVENNLYYLGNDAPFDFTVSLFPAFPSMTTATITGWKNTETNEISATIHALGSYELTGYTLADSTNYQITGAWKCNVTINRRVMVVTPLSVGYTGSAVTAPPYDIYPDSNSINPGEDPSLVIRPELSVTSLTVSGHNVGAIGSVYYTIADTDTQDPNNYAILSASAGNSDDDFIEITESNVIAEVGVEYYDRLGPNQYELIDDIVPGEDYVDGLYIKKAGDSDYSDGKGWDFEIVKGTPTVLLEETEHLYYLECAPSDWSDKLRIAITTPNNETVEVDKVLYSYDGGEYKESLDDHDWPSLEVSKTLRVKVITAATDNYQATEDATYDFVIQKAPVYIRTSAELTYNGDPQKPEKATYTYYIYQIGEAYRWEIVKWSFALSQGLFVPVGQDTAPMDGLYYKVGTSGIVAYNLKEGDDVTATSWGENLCMLDQTKYHSLLVKNAWENTLSATNAGTYFLSGEIANDLSDYYELIINTPADPLTEQEEVVRDEGAVYKINKKAVTINGKTVGRDYGPGVYDGGNEMAPLQYGENAFVELVDEDAESESAFVGFVENDTNRNYESRAYYSTENLGENETGWVDFAELSSDLPEAGTRIYWKYAFSWDNYACGTVTGSFVLAPRQVHYTINGTVSEGSASIYTGELSISYEYNASAQVPTVIVNNGVNGNLRVLFSTVNGSVAGEVYTPDEGTDATNVGVHRITITSIQIETAPGVYETASNYTIANGITAFYYAITPATLTITPKDEQTKVYGEDDPVFGADSYTYSGKKGEDAPTFTGALGRAAGESVNNYAMNLGTLALDDDSASANVNRNYIIVLDDATVNFSITPRHITVLFTNVTTKEYTSSRVDPDYEFTNVAARDKKNIGTEMEPNWVTDKTKLDLGNWSNTYAAGSFSNKYFELFGSEKGNYILDVVADNDEHTGYYASFDGFNMYLFKIQPKTVELTLVGPTNTAYNGGQINIISASYSPVGGGTLYYYDDNRDGNANDKFVGQYNTNARTHVTNSNITFTIHSADSNYIFKTPNGVTEYSADAYGYVTYVYRVSPVSVGVNWSIEENHEFGYTGTTQSYPTASATGINEEGSLSINVTIGDSKTFRNHDNYTFTASTTNADYTLTNNQRNVSIGQGTLTVRANDISNYVYGDELSFTASVTGFEGDDNATNAVTNIGTISASCSDYSRYDDIPVGGTATISASKGSLTANNDNYIIITDNGTLTIAQREVTVEWSETTALSFNGKAQVVGVTFGNRVNNDEIAPVYDEDSYRTDACAKSSLAEYTATLIGLNNANYKLPLSGLDCAYTILPKEVAVTIDEVDLVYSATAKELSGKYLAYNSTSEAFDKPTNADFALKSGDDNTSAGSVFHYIITITDKNYRLIGGAGYTWDEEEGEFIATATITAGQAILVITTPSSWKYDKTEKSVTADYYRYDTTKENNLGEKLGEASIALKDPTNLDNEGDNTNAGTFRVIFTIDSNYTLLDGDDYVATGIDNVGYQDYTIDQRTITVTYTNGAETPAYQHLEITYGEEIGLDSPASCLLIDDGDYAPGDTLWSIFDITLTCKSALDGVGSPITDFATQVKNAGYYILGISLKSSATTNYDLVNYVNNAPAGKETNEAYLQIKPKPVKVTISDPNLAYSGTAKAVTASFTNADNETVTAADYFVITYNGTGSDEVNDENLDRTNVTGSAFYAFVAINDTNYVIEEDDDYTLIDGRARKSYTVTKKALTVIPYGNNVYYGKEFGRYDGDYRIEGFENGETEESLRELKSLRGEIKFDYGYTKMQDIVYDEGHEGEYGSYPITLNKESTLEADNYSISYATATLRIMARPITVFIHDQTATYGDSLADLYEEGENGGWNLSGQSMSIVNDELPFELLCDVKADRTSDANTYTITGNVTNANYHITFKNGKNETAPASYTIRPMRIKVRVADTYVTYDGIMHDDLEAIVLAEDEQLLWGYDWIEEDQDMRRYNALPANGTFTDIGSLAREEGVSADEGSGYTITFTPGDNSNYTILSEENGSVFTAKYYICNANFRWYAEEDENYENPLIGVEQEESLSYDGTDLTVTLREWATSVNEQPISYKYILLTETLLAQENIDLTQLTYAAMPPLRNAGEYVFAYEISAPNHNPTYGTFCVYVDKAPLDVTVAKEDVIYTASAVEAPTLANGGIKVTGFVDADKEDAAKLITEDLMHVVYIRRDLDMTMEEQMNAVMKEYHLDIDIVDEESFNLYCNGFLAFLEDHAATPKTVGTYYVDVIMDDLDNYYAISVGAEFTITPKPVELVWTVVDKDDNDRTDSVLVYNAGNYSYSATVTNGLGSDEVAVIAYSDNVKKNAGNYTARAVALNNPNYTLIADGSGETTIYVDSSRKEWAINAKELTVGWEANKSWTYNGRVQDYQIATADTGIEDEEIALTVTEKENKVFKVAGSYTLVAAQSTPNANYILVNTEKAVSIAQKPITATIAAQTSAYGETRATLSLANKGAVEVGDSLSYIIDCAVDSESPVGAYDITAQDLDPNYEITFVNGIGAYTVTNAILTEVSVAQSGKLTYNSAEQAVAVTATAVAVNDQAVIFTYALKEDGEYTVAMPKLKDVGEHTVYFKASAANHGEVTGSFKVTIDPNVSGVSTGKDGETILEYPNEKIDETAASTEGVSVKNTIENYLDAVDLTGATDSSLGFEIGEETLVTFDLTALRVLSENTGASDVKITYNETKKGGIDHGKKGYEDAEFVISISLGDVKFDGGKATISTSFDNKAPSGKKAVLYYVNANGEKTEVTNAKFENGKVTFTTSHFSDYIVVYEFTAGAIVGIVVGCVVAAGGIAVGVFFFLKKRKAAKASSTEAAEEAQAEDSSEDAE